jgi:hypothetical protein
MSNVEPGLQLVKILDMNIFERTWFNPTFSELLADRRAIAMIAGAGALHLGLSMAGISIWSCPFRAVTGVPCPGCGLTRATIELLLGDLTGSLHTHAFAPVFIAGLALMFVSLVLPERPRQRLFSALHNWEARYGLTSWVLFGLVLYWVVRLMGWIPFPRIF